MSGLLKLGLVCLLLLLVGSSVAITVVEDVDVLEGMWLAANTIFTTGFAEGPDSDAGRLVVMATMLVMVPCWLLVLVGCVETAAWRVERRRLTEGNRTSSGHRRD
jgi:hypothetical protein